MILTVSCGTGPSDVIVHDVCPGVVAYPAEQTDRVADELATLPDRFPVAEWAADLPEGGLKSWLDSLPKGPYVVREFVKDYKVMRDEARACDQGG